MFINVWNISVPVFFKKDALLTLYRKDIFKLLSGTNMQFSKYIRFKEGFNMQYFTVQNVNMRFNRGMVKEKICVGYTDLNVEKKLISRRRKFIIDVTIGPSTSCFTT